jgi:hypothetical protein
MSLDLFAGNERTNIRLMRSGIGRSLPSRWPKLRFASEIGDDISLSSSQAQDYCAERDLGLNLVACNFPFNTRPASLLIGEPVKMQGEKGRALPRSQIHGAYVATIRREPPVQALPPPEIVTLFSSIRLIVHIFHHFQSGTRFRGKLPHSTHPVATGAWQRYRQKLPSSTSRTALTAWATPEAPRHRTPGTLRKTTRETITNVDSVFWYFRAQSE